MAGLRSYPHNRFVGVRATMTVYDTDDPEQRTAAEEALAAGEVASTFGPDTVTEARNRGFRPAQTEASPPK